MEKVVLDPDLMASKRFSWQIGNTPASTLARNSCVRVT